MRIPRLFVDAALSVGADTELNDAQSRYLGSVLRMQLGRELIIFNGRGGEYKATLAELSKRSARVNIVSFEDIERESPLQIHLGIGLSRGDKFDFVVQKATELGVNFITPLFTTRSEVKLKGERLEKKISHWQQIAYSASEQCQRNLPTRINPPVNYGDWLSSVNADLKLVLHHRSDTRLNEHLKPASIALVIGPEGGLSEEEIEQALVQKFNALTLGPRIFRTETAPMVALSLLQYQWGDF